MPSRRMPGVVLSGEGGARLHKRLMWPVKLAGADGRNCSADGAVKTATVAGKARFTSHQPWLEQSASASAASKSASSATSSVGVSWASYGHQVGVG